MFDRELAVEQLSLIELAAERVQRRIEGLETPNDLIATEEGQLRFDGILMMIVAIGEQLKKMDKHVPADFFARYPSVDWTAAKGMRDRISHEYFAADPETTFLVAKNRIPELLQVVRQIKQDLQAELTDGQS